jgi:hypothetical protein
MGICSIQMVQVFKIFAALLLLETVGDRTFYTVKRLENMFCGSTRAALVMRFLRVPAPQEASS